MACTSSHILVNTDQDEEIINHYLGRKGICINL